MTVTTDYKMTKAEISVGRTSIKFIRDPLLGLLLHVADVPVTGLARGWQYGLSQDDLLDLGHALLELADQ